MEEKGAGRFSNQGRLANLDRYTTTTSQTFQLSDGGKRTVQWVPTSVIGHDGGSPHLKTESITNATNDTPKSPISSVIYETRITCEGMVQ